MICSSETAKKARCTGTGVRVCQPRRGGRDGISLDGNAQLVRSTSTDDDDDDDEDTCNSGNSR